MRPPLRNSPSDILVVGYGNELRSDDAVGPTVVARVAEWRDPRIQALACQQLTPELVDALAAARTAIFVDATLDPALVDVEARPLTAAVSVPAPALGHTSQPAWLLALTQQVHGRCPETWLVSVPVANLEFGSGLSATAQHGVDGALELIRHLCESSQSRLPHASR